MAGKRAVRLELTAQVDTDNPESLREVAAELEAALPDHQWAALLALAQAVAERAAPEAVIPSFRLPDRTGH